MKTTAALSLVLLFALNGCAPESTTDATDTSPPPSVTEAPSAEPTDATEPVDEPTSSAPELDDTERATVLAVLESGRLDELQPYLADPVDYILAASECCGPLHPAEVENASGALRATGWEPLPAATLEAIRLGWYYESVPADAFAARADDDTIVVFGIADGLITSILIGDEFTLTS